MNRGRGSVAVLDSCNQRLDIRIGHFATGVVRYSQRRAVIRNIKDHSTDRDLLVRDARSDRHVDAGSTVAVERQDLVSAVQETTWRDRQQSHGSVQRIDVRYRNI